MKQIELILLISSVFLILPYLSLISTWGHEEAHVVAFAKYGIESSYTPDIIGQIPNFYGPLSKRISVYGTTYVNSTLYSQLNNSARAEVNMAGTSSDLNFLNGIICLLFFINLIPLLLEILKGKINVKNKLPILATIYWIDFLVIAWMISIVGNIQSNLFVSNADLSQLLSLWCSKC
jgi:hypothetical protein